MRDDFYVGCNYWASHAGTQMWSDFRPDVVKDDFKKLQATGVRVVRLFPLWSDFQPISLLRGGSGEGVQYRMGEELLGDDPVSQCGVDATMLDRFAIVADAAQEHGIRLLVGLVTGWMSGRFFAPPALEHRNAIADPESILWQVRFVKTFVGRFKNHPAILAWDLGNECNCMGHATRPQAWAWTHAISSAIRCEDATRPVYSGMHSLSAGPAGPWTISDQAELTDVLCTHPYPAFTPGCDLDPLPSFRPAHHAAAESALYADLGKKPCIVEEIGTLGDEFANEQSAADYVRMSLYTSWAMSATGFLWWCGFDQGHLSYAPYDWCGVERELGLFRNDGSAKPVAHELRAFSQFLESFPLPQLPPRLTEAVCILTEGQDHWRVAYSAFLLARQAGFDLRFCYCDQPIPDAPIYLMPCYSGLRPISRHRWLGLQERIAAGATLYLSHSDGVLTQFRHITGLEVVTRSRTDAPVQFSLPGSDHKLRVNAPIHLQLKPTGASVLASDDTSNPVFSRYAFGKGEVLFLSVPLEAYLAGKPGAFDDPSYSAIYKQITSGALLQRAVTSTATQVGVSEHPIDDRSRAIVQINYTGTAVKPALPKMPWRVTRWLTAENTLAPFGAAVYVVER